MDLEPTSSWIFARCGTGMLLGAILGASLAAPQAIPIGPEIQVNTEILGSQFAPDLAIDGNNGFIVVWGSATSTGTDSSGYSAQAQRYDGGGLPVGPQFQVNSYTTGDQYAPDVAADDLGGFVVAWTSYGSAGTDTDLASIQARRFDPNGMPLGDDFQVNSATSDRQHHGDVAMDGAGSFVVAWASYDVEGPDLSPPGIRAQRFDAAGLPFGGELQLNSLTTSGQSLPAVRVTPDGGFVVAWHSGSSGGTDTSGLSIQVRRFAADGTPLGPEVQVNTYTTDLQVRPSVAVDEQGGFFVVWESRASDGPDTSGWTIRGRRFDAAGAPLGDELQINSYTTNNQALPYVAAAVGGGFVATWASFGSGGSDSSSWSIQARRFDDSGGPLGPDFQVNEYTTSTQFRPRVAADALERFVVVWHGRGSGGSDQSGYSIHARRYQAALFYDGFETGDTARWTLQVP